MMALFYSQRIRTVSFLLQNCHVQALRALTMDHSRYYKNQYEDYSKSCHSTIVDTNTNDLHSSFKDILTANTRKLLQNLEQNSKHWINRDDYSVYTGTTGVAYMFYHYGKRLNDPVYISKAVEMLKESVAKYKSKREITFLTGMVGPLALAAVIYHAHGNLEESRKMIAKLKSLSSQIYESEVPDELLYGKAGFLYALLFVNANIAPQPIEDALIAEVMNSIINSGIMYSRARQCESTLMYSWHGSEYLGGAHGLAGIIYILLQGKQYLTHAQFNDIKAALYYIQSLKFPSGNFPSSVGSRSDKLVQFCHGAPGMTMVFALAYEVFQENQFLETAIACGEVVWQRGLVKKGHSICHGVAGNAYTFLHLFQLTQDPKYLYRACKFAEWSMNYGDHQNKPPDRPFSLFEGLAGVIYFLCDLQQPRFAKFPGYAI